jgi:hypothetical protein
MPKSGPRSATRAACQPVSSRASTRPQLRFAWGQILQSWVSSCQRVAGHQPEAGAARRPGRCHEPTQPGLRRRRAQAQAAGQSHRRASPEASEFALGRASSYNGNFPGSVRAEHEAVRAAVVPAWAVVAGSPVGTCAHRRTQPWIENTWRTLVGSEAAFTLVQRRHHL